ncbi:MAG: MFS transporter [Oscillochloridaceae bacterium umkhey_bin13]
MRADSAPAAPPLSAQSRRPILTVLFVGVFMAALDTAVVAPAIPALRLAFGVDNSQIGMLTIVFSLFTLSSTTLMAAMGDRYGRRPIFLACVFGFAASSLLIALAPTFTIVLIGRAIQGFCAGGVTPLASAMVGDIFPPAERGKALGMLGATFGMAFLLGPVVAALILTVLGWQWIFLLNLPVAAVVIWLGWRNLPATRAEGPPDPLDWAGIGLIALSLSALVLGINRVLDTALGMTLWPWLLALAALCIPALIAVERRAARPVVPLHLFANRQLALTYLLCAGAGFGMGSVVFISSVAVAGLGIAPEQAGMLLIPLVLASTAGSMIFGRLLNSIGSRIVMLIGFSTLALGSLLLTFTGAALGLWIFLPASMLIGLGVGIVVGGTLRTIVLNEVSFEERGAAQGLVNVGISVGNLLVVAVLGVLADAAGGGMTGLGVAYMSAAALMALMTVLSLGLKPLHEEQMALATSTD